MSETTSTNISVAPANSTESIPAFSTRNSRMTGPGFTKRICFYKSGDPRFNGIKMVVTNRSFKTFDALLDSLSKKVPLPFGVRNITTPRGIHPVTTLEELEDGKSYICSHQKKIKPINLERASKKPLLWQSSRPISARRRAMQGTRQSEVTPFQRENTIVLRSSKNFVVYKNGDKEFKQNLVLNKKSIQNFDAFLDQISEALQFPVFKLYSIDGRRILSTHALLLSSGTIVAAGREPFKAVNYESEAEYLPAKLPGIYQRVFPKSRTKPEMRSHVNTNEPVTIPSDHEHVHTLANVCDVDRNLVEFSHIPDNEIHLTQQWPNSGEELPVISPGDNIEKSVHLNCDGTMTVEMKVRFKIREEETINWSTTVSRANLSYCKNKVFGSSVNPESQAVSIRDSSETTSSDHKIHDETIDSIEHKYETHVERVQNLIQDNDVNSDQFTTSPIKKEKIGFYRPPTPGIRKSQERRLSIRRASEGKLQENMKQMFGFNEMQHNSIQAVNDIVDHCNKQILTTADNVNLKSNGVNPKQTEIDHTHVENLSRSDEETLQILQNPQMELLHRNTEYKKGVMKSNRSDYICFTGPPKVDRPYSAGKYTYHQDQFKFKEIKRSMSASITFSETSPLHGETTHLNNESELDLKDYLDSVSPGNAITPMAAVPSTKSSNKTHGTKDLSSATTRGNVIKGSGTDSYLSNDNNSTSSIGQKKKKKKSMGDSFKEVHTNIPNHGQPNIESPQIVSEISCGGMIPETKHIMFEEIFPPQKSSIINPSEVGPIRKLKGNKQMAKVKPRSVKTNDKSIYSLNQNSQESEEKTPSAEIEINSSKVIAEYSGTIVSNGSILYTDYQSEYPLTEYNHVTDEHVPKKTSEISKRSQKTAKKQKVTKNKKNNRLHESKTATNTNILDSEEVCGSPDLPNPVESYVQNWLTNIFPNAALPVLQLLSSTRLEDDLTRSSKDSFAQPHAETTKMMTGEVCGNAVGSQMHNRGEEHQVEPIHTEPMTQKEMFIQHVKSFTNDGVSVVMENSKHFGHNTFCESNKAEDLIKWMASHQPINVPPKKASTDAAVQVENKTLVDYIKCSCLRDVLAEQLELSPHNIQNSKCRQLEKSVSLPNSPSKVGSSSSQLLLAWLIVLHLKQGMYQAIEGLSSSPKSSSTIFTLLQSLKQIAVTEKADDLKAAVLNLQETKFNLVTNNVQSLTEPIPMQECPGVPTNSIDSDQLPDLNGKDEMDSLCITEPCDKSDLLKNDVQNVLAGDSDDLRFFASELCREFSGEHCHNESCEFLQQCSLLEPQESFNMAATGLPMEVKESISTYKSEYNMKTSRVSPKKGSKVKMMVQEMEHRKNIPHASEHQKCLQSPMSSDWSDYRPDSEESMSDNLRSSSEIMTESGEEQVHKKLFKTGYVKRTIERLYGKAESIVKLPKTSSSVSPINVIQTQPKKSPKNKNNEQLGFHSECHQCVSIENILSPSNNKEIVRDNFSSLKSSSLPLMETADNHDNLISQRQGSSQNKDFNKHFLNEGSHVETGTSTDGGVLIDKGRWLLKENHLVRTSPPAITGMYTNLDTTSADTLLDNTSDDISYLHFACKINPTLAEVSSSELEDMAKPLHSTCHYFNMPHGSDSEPFNDAFSTKSKVRPKSSDDLVKTKIHDSVSLESRKKFGAKSASLTSFTTVDFHYSDNKVHPLPLADAASTTDGEPLHPTSASRRQVKEQDSLDKLQIICGQHCPILTAIINPINEKDRGFAYRRPYDIENLLLLHSVPTKEASIPWLNKSPLIDENNNIHYNMQLPIIKCSKHDSNRSFIYDYNDIVEGIEAFRNMSKGSQCLSSLYPISAIQIVNLIRLYSETQNSNMFQGVSCMENDENNNILYPYI